MCIRDRWYDVDYLKEFEAAPVCRINPEDAAELGIEEGDTVRLYNCLLYTSRCV